MEEEVDPSNVNDPLDLDQDVGIESDDEVPPAVAGNGPVAPLPVNPTGQLDADAAAVLSTQHESALEAIKKLESELSAVKLKNLQIENQLSTGPISRF